MFTAQKILHHLSGTGVWLRRHFERAPRQVLDPPARAKRRLSGLARPGLRAHPEQGPTRSTSLTGVAGTLNKLAMMAVRRVMCDHNKGDDTVAGCIATDDSLVR